MTRTHARTKVIPSLRRRLLGFLSVEVLVGFSVAVALGALAAVTADALLVLSEWVRAHAHVALGAVGVAAAVWGVLKVHRLSELKVARTVERASPALGTAVTNAVQLAQTTCEFPAAEVLRRQAVVYGREKVRALRAWPVARRGVLGFLVSAGVTVLLWVGALVLFPDVFDAVLPRYLDPHGDHPPYNRLHIEVASHKAEVLYGGQCDIRATTSGAPVEKLYLVAQNTKGVTDTIMFRRPDRSYSQTLTNLREETRFWVTDGRARSLRHTIRIRYTPRITFLEVSTVYPSYTGLSPHTRELRESTLAVPKRTALTFRAGSNRPLASGTLELTPVLGGDKKVIQLTPEHDGGQVVSGGFRVEEAVVFSISLTDVDGLGSQESRKGRVTLLPDMRPRLFVMEPGRHAVATPEVSIPVRVRAEDDYAVERVLWFRGLNRSIERSCRMKNVVRTGAAAAEARGEFSLKDLGVKPGDHIEYFFEALDNYPDGPNVTTSRIYALEIISPEEYRRLLRQMAAQRALFEQYRSLDSHLRRTLERARTLRDKQRQLSKKEKPSDADRASLRREAQDFRRAVEEYRRALARAIDTSPLFDVEKAFKQHLRKQKRVLDRLTRDLDEMMAEAGPSGMFDPEKMDKLVDELAGLFEDMARRVGEPVRLIVAVVRLLAYANEFVRLAVQQREIAKLARRFRDQKQELTRIEQMELQEIASAERQVRDGLRHFMETLPGLAAKVPDDKEYESLKKSALDFLKKVRDADIQVELDKAAEKFSALDGPGGYPPARNAAERMMALVSQLDDMNLAGLAQGALVFQPALTGSLGDSLKQILSALAGGGMGGSGSGVYGLYGEGVGLYGPDMQLAGGPSDGLGPPQGDASARGRETAAGDATDDALPRPGDARVRLRRNVKFPLRYRDLVGEYFRVVAESQGR